MKGPSIKQYEQKVKLSKATSIITQRKQGNNSWTKPKTTCLIQSFITTCLIQSFILKFFAHEDWEKVKEKR